MKLLIAGLCALAAVIAYTSESGAAISDTKRQVIFSLTPQADGKTVKCTFERSQEVNYASHEVRASTFRPSATFVAKACKTFLAQYWHTWDFMKGKADEDYCFWVRENPDDPVFPAIAQS